MAPRPRSERTARDNARARALGYKSYYDYRIHGSGKIPPGEPVRGEALARARGHRSLADLEDLVARGKVTNIVATPVGRRKPDGTYPRVHVDAWTIGPDGKPKRVDFRLTGKQLNRANLRRLKGTMDNQGVFYVDTPSLSLMKYIRPGGKDEDEDEESDTELDETDFEDLAGA